MQSRADRQNPLYKKDSELHCAKCGSHVLTVKCDLFRGDYFDEYCINQSEGQAPWKYGDRTCCRKCGEVFFDGFLLKGNFKNKEVENAKNFINNGTGREGSSET